METVAQLGARISDVKETAGALARAAGKRLDEVRTGTADAIHSAASSVRSTVRNGAEAIDDFASDAAEKLESAVAHVEKHHLNHMPTGLRRAVRRYPASCLIAATAMGFLAATVFRAMTHTCERD
jgi:hypothetical protein